MRRRWTSFTAIFVALSLLLFAGPSAAQTLTFTLSGEATNCEFSQDEGPVEVSFTVSRGDGVAEVNLGGNLGSIPVDAGSFDEIIDAVAQSGGSFTISIVDESLGDPSFCLFNGTITFSLSGGGIGPNSPGNLATTQTLLDNFVRQALPAVSSRIRTLFSGAGNGMLASANGVTVSGMAAGNGDRPPIGVWAGYSYTDSKNDFASTAFTSTRHNVLLGLDTMPSENFIVGVSVALEHTSVHTRFGGGGEQDITGISVTPYAGYLLSDWLSVDAAVGVSTVQNDQFRTAGGARVTSDVESTRLFGSANVTGTWTFAEVLASARAGFLYATQDDDSFVESDGTPFGDMRSTVGRFLLGGELAYSAGAWEPYTGATFEHDFTRTRLTFAPNEAPKSDKSGVLVAVGLRYFGTEDLSGYIEYSTLLGRRNLDEDTFSANLRWEY